MCSEEFILEALQQPLSAITYSMSRRLAAVHPDLAMVEGPADGFDPIDFAASGHCSLNYQQDIHQQVATQWEGENAGLSHAPHNAWIEVTWQGYELTVVLMTWSTGFCRQRYAWILAEDKQTAEDFFENVSEWSSTLRSEVLVFDGGEWQKDKQLYRSIRNTTFDSLILADTLKSDIADDVARFFAAEERYAQYRLPWKRGLLFVGPPGNGKTHAVKAVIQAAAKPCIYIKSFETHFGTAQGSMGELFRRARKSTPCILVFEDLDSLVKEETRAFFLNELDGFADNSGILTLATTNHPERLDTSLLERPSRFDRKYQFDLPAPGERLAYLKMWNESLDLALRLSDAGLQAAAEDTAGFSFAYLKELMLSAVMRWIDNGQSNMDQVIASVRDLLRGQLDITAAQNKPGRVDRWFARRLNRLRIACEQHAKAAQP